MTEKAKSPGDKSPGEMTFDELTAEIKRQEAYLTELREHLAASLEQKEKRLRAELDAVLEQKRSLTGRTPTQAATGGSRKRRTKEQVEADARRIYEVIAGGRGLTRAELQAKLPGVTLPLDIVGQLKRFGLKVEGAGPKKNYRYTAVK